jgi:hypothetical protein
MKKIKEILVHLFTLPPPQLHHFFRDITVDTLLRVHNIWCSEQERRGNGVSELRVRLIDEYNTPAHTHRHPPTPFARWVAE